jgi:hypothetical protein
MLTNECLNVTKGTTLAPFKKHTKKYDKFPSVEEILRVRGNVWGLKGGSAI